MPHVFSVLLPWLIGCSAMLVIRKSHKLSFPEKRNYLDDEKHPLGWSASRKTSNCWPLRIAEEYVSRYNNKKYEYVSRYNNKKYEYVSRYNNKKYEYVSRYNNKKYEMATCIPKQNDACKGLITALLSLWSPISHSPPPPPSLPNTLHSKIMQNNRFCPTTHCNKTDKGMGSK